MRSDVRVWGLFLLIGLGGAFSSPLPTGTNTDVVLDMRRVIDLALGPAVQLRLRSAAIEKQLAEARLKQVEAAHAIQVNATASDSVLRFDLRSLGFDIPEVSPFVVNVNAKPVVGPFSLLDTRLAASKSIFDRALRGQIATERSKVDESRSKEQVLRAQIAAEAARAYLTALFAESAIAITEAGVRQAELAARVAAEQKAQGLVTGAEVRKAAVDCVSAEQRLIAAKSDSQLAMLQLKAITGIAFETRLRLTPLPPPSQPPAGIPEAVRQGVQSRGDLRAMNTRLEVLRRAGDAIDAQKYPVVAAFGNVGTLVIGPAGSQAISGSYTYTAGVALRLNLLDGGRRSAQLAEIALQKRAVANASEQVRQEIDFQVRVAFEKLQAAEQQMALAAREVRLLEEDIAQVRGRKAAGEASGLEIATSEARLLRSQHQHRVFEHQWNLARLSLAEAMGTVTEASW